MLFLGRTLPLKGYFQLKTKKSLASLNSAYSEFDYLQIFSLNWSSWHFGPNLCRKGISSWKQKMWNRHWTQHIQISLGPRFQLKLIIWHFGPNLSKKAISIGSLIWIKQATKFQLKVTILIFWTKFALKRHPVKNGKSEQHH